MGLTPTELEKIRRSGIIATAVLFAIGTLHLLKGHHRPSIALYVLAGIFFIMTRFSPLAFKKIAQTIGELITGLLLSIVFYSVITPMGLIIRLLGKDTLDKKIEKEKDSYWIEKEDVTRYEEQF